MVTAKLPVYTLSLVLSIICFLFLIPIPHSIERITTKISQRLNHFSYRHAFVNCWCPGKFKWNYLESSLFATIALLEQKDYYKLVNNFTLVTRFLFSTLSIFEGLLLVLLFFGRSFCKYFSQIE